MNFLDRSIIKLSNRRFKAKKVIDQYKDNNPDETIIFYISAKGRETVKDDVIDVKFTWAFAKKGIFILTDKRIVFNEWNIDLSNVEYAKYAKYNGVLNKILVLKIETKEGENYQIGTIFNAELLDQKVLDLKETKAGTLLSNFGLVIKLYFFILLIKFVLSYL